VKETDWLNSNPCISGKPVVYLINLNEDKFIKKKSKWLPKVKKATLLHTTPVVTNMQEVGFVLRLWQYWVTLPNHAASTVVLTCCWLVCVMSKKHSLRHYCVCAAWVVTLYTCRCLNGSRIMAVNLSFLSAVSLKANWWTCLKMSETSTAKRYALQHVPQTLC